MPTTKPCRHPECARPGQRLPLAEFCKNSRERDGLSRYCSGCRTRIKFQSEQRVSTYRTQQQRDAAARLRRERLARGGKP